jgi:hypothetical protein
VSGPTMSQSKKRAFLAAYPECGTVKAAAEAVKIDRKTHYRWLASDPEYVKSFEQAKEDAGDLLEAEAIRRAFHGVKEPVGWYQGQPGGTITRYSDTLLIFLLKGLRPEKYRENVKAAPEESEVLARRLKEALNAIEETDGE